MTNELKVFYNCDKGLMTFDNKKTIFQHREFREGVKQGLGIILKDNYFDKGNYAFAVFKNVPTVLLESYNDINLFVNYKVPYNLEKDLWSEPIIGTGGSQFIAKEKNGLYTATADVTRTIDKEITNYEITFTFTINEHFTYEKYCIKNGSLVISKNASPVKMAIVSVQEGNKILANGNLYVIELDEDSFKNIDVPILLLG